MKADFTIFSLASRPEREYEVRLPMKMDETVPAEKFLDLRWVEEVRKELPQKVSK